MIHETLKINIKLNKKKNSITLFLSHIGNETT